MMSVLRRPRATRPTPEVAPEVELPSSVMRALDGARLHERAASDTERFAVSLAVAGLPFMDSPEQAATALAKSFPELQPRQVEAADYLRRVIRLRKRELRKQQRGTGFVHRWKEGL